MGQHGGDTGQWPGWAGHSPAVDVGPSVTSPSFSVTLLTTGMLGFPQGDPGEVTQGLAVVQGVTEQRFTCEYRGVQREFHTAPTV